LALPSRRQIVKDVLERITVLDWRGLQTQQDTSVMGYGVPERERMFSLPLRDPLGESREN